MSLGITNYTSMKKVQRIWCQPFCCERGAKGNSPGEEKLETQGRRNSKRNDKYLVNTIKYFFLLAA